MDSESAIEDCYRGEYFNEKQFTIEYFEELGTIEEFIRPYVDYQALSDDIFMDDFFSVEVKGLSITHKLIKV